MEIDDLFIPENLYYTEEHEWVLIEDNGQVKVGITDYAQQKLHEIVFVDLPSKDDNVKQGDSIGTAESVKAVSEIFCPISGQVLKGNNELILNPELVNQDPYGKGWIVIIKPKNFESERIKLMTQEEYKEYVEKILRKNIEKSKL